MASLFGPSRLHACDPACRHPATAGFDCAPVDRGRRGVLAGLAAGVTAGVAANLRPAFAQSSATADLVLVNGKIATLDPALPFAEALAVKGTDIQAVGTRAQIEALRGPGTRLIDLGGRTVVPGLIDSHSHLIRGGLTYSQELRWDGVPSLAVALRMLREQAARTPAPHWVQVVGGFSPQQFHEKRLPTLDEVNAATGDVPCFIMSLYDRALLNRAAMRVLGWNKDTPNPFGSSLEKDGAGNPTGLVVNQTSLGGLVGLFARVPKLSPDDQIVSSRLYMAELNRLGLTSVVDAGGGGQNFPENYQAIRQLAVDDRLTVRIGYMLFAQAPGKEIENYRTWAGMVKPGEGTDHLRLAGAGEYTVWAATDPANFAKDAPPPPAVMESQLIEVTRFLVERGWPFRMHASYDQTAGRILDVLEKVHREVPLTSVRWGLDHCESLSPQSLERIARMGGGVAVQNRMSLDGEAFAAKWGEEAAGDAPPIGRIRSMGVPLACGTDSNRATSYNPWISLHWLLTGETMGGRKLNADRNLVDRMTALRLWTLDGARLTGEEARKGSLQVGKWADLAVLSDDYFAVPDARVKQITAVMTMVGGKVVHGEKDFAALAPAPLPVMPDWLPIKTYGGYQQASADPGCCGAHGAAAPVFIGDAGAWRYECRCGVI